MDLRSNNRHHRNHYHHHHNHQHHFSREDDLLTDMTEDSAVAGNTLTCPSCRISIIPTRIRSMCPFCGSFYDPSAEVDVTQRIQQQHQERKNHNRLQGNKGILNEDELDTSRGKKEEQEENSDRIPSSSRSHNRNYGRSGIEGGSSSRSRNQASEDSTVALRLPRIVSINLLVLPSRDKHFL